MHVSDSCLRFVSRKVTCDQSSKPSANQSNNPISTNKPSWPLKPSLQQYWDQGRAPVLQSDRPFLHTFFFTSFPSTPQLTLLPLVSLSIALCFVHFVLSISFSSPGSSPPLTPHSFLPPYLSGKRGSSSESDGALTGWSLCPLLRACSCAWALWCLPPQTHIHAKTAGIHPPTHMHAYIYRPTEGAHMCTYSHLHTPTVTAHACVCVYSFM